MLVDLALGTADGLFYPVSTGPADFAGHEIAAVESVDGELWAIVKRSEVWSGTRGSWNLLGHTEDARLNCLLVGRDEVLAGAASGRLLQLVDRSLQDVPGFTSAPDRAEWYTPWGGPPDVRSLAARNGYVLANVHVGGILRSDDGGINWAPTIDIHSDVHQVAVGPEDSILAATAYGLAISRDRGATWDFDESNLHASYARALGVADGTIVMSACVGPHGGRAAVYRREFDGDAGFVRCEKGLPGWFQDNIDTGCIATRGRSVAFATSDGRVFVSDDAAATWSQVGSGLPPARWLTFV
jgi:hypothetical protein